MEAPSVDQLLSRPVETVTTDTTITEAAATFLEHDVGAVVVEDETHQLAGLLTVTDVVAFVSDGAARPDAPVQEWMRTNVITISPETTVHRAAETMIENLVHHVPVVDGDDVVGMITTLDLTAYLARSA